MDSNYRAYDHIASFGRLDEILAQPSGNFEEVNELPDRDRLTFTNGFYAECTAMFVDIRESSSLPNHYNRPALARLYRAYISEMVAILNGTTITREVNIVGDGVWAVFNTPLKSHIDTVFACAFEANSLVKVLNYKLAKKDYKKPIAVGIGLANGRALMIKAGHKGSTINDVVYMGDVVNSAAKLAARGSLNSYTPPIFMDDNFRWNLNEHNQGLTRRSGGYGHWTSDAISVVMDDWYDKNCQ
jgi:class 3 adenylate cyclase